MKLPLLLTKACIILFIFLFINISLVSSAPSVNDEMKYYEKPIFDQEIIKSFSNYKNEDFDPLVDIVVTVDINCIRALDIIDKHSDPDFFVKVIINGEVFQSPVWKNQKYLYNLDWSCTADVPDDEEFVDIQIQLWDWNIGKNTLCDIATNDNSNPDCKELDLFYSIKSGHWDGNDYYYPYPTYFDVSGYGRGNGCDDNSIYQDDNDCEIYFDIKQNDFDNDTLPYWTETNVYFTDPTVDDTGRDDDNDSIPIEWEHKWGHYFDWFYNDETNQWEIGDFWYYDPFEWNDHAHIDLDNDALSNIQEYMTSQWGSDPYRADVFVELDQMGAGPNGEKASILPDTSKELIRDAFQKHNILFFLDDGSWEETGSEIIPFDNTGDNTTWFEINNIYNQYFLHRNEDNWRKDVFHYGIVIYNAEGAPGFCYRNNAFQISQVGLEKKVRSPFAGKEDIVYASAYMHELGHSLGLVWLGGHAENAYYPWQPAYWKWRPYRSIMNYGYMYGGLSNHFMDYSDGSHGKNDFDDWSNIDFKYFKAEL